MSDLSVKVGTDVSEIKKGLKEVSTQISGLSGIVQKETKTSKVAFGAFIGTIGAAAVTKAFSVVAGGLRSFAGSLRESIALSKAQEEAVNDLESALARTGKFTSEASKDFQDFASQLQATSRFGDEVILKNAAMIQSLGELETDGLKRATEASVNFAAALGVNLETASNILGKAASGNVQALRRYGIEIDSTGNKTKDFELVLQQIERRFGGAAQQQVASLEGRYTQFGNSVGDLREEFGAVVTQNDAVIGSFDGLRKVADQLVEIISNNREEIDAFITEGVLKLTDVIPFAARAINGLIDTFTFFREIKGVAKVLLLDLADTYLAFGETVVGTANSIGKFVGINSELLESSEQGFKRLREIINESQNDIAAESFEFIRAQDAKKKAIEDFAESARETIRQSIADQEEFNSDEVNLERSKQAQLLEEREEFNDINKEITEREIEDFFLSQQEKLNFIRKILGEEEALREEARARELAGKGDLAAAEKQILAARSKAEKENILAVRDFEELSQKERVANVKSSLGQISSLQQESSSELFAIGKAAAIAQAKIDGFAAVQKALSSAPAPLNFALAAIVGAAQAANIARIAQVQKPTAAFRGALVEGGSILRDTEPFMLSKGEVVAPRKDFDDVVEGTARQRGFVKKDEASEDSKAPIINLSIGEFIGDEEYTNRLIERIREANLFRNADLGI